MTNEEKLKEDIQKEWDNLKRFPTTGQELNEYVIKCLTSEAAREYWQQQQAPDMGEIINDFKKYCVDNGGFNLSYDEMNLVFSFFAPLIKGSDAVEFAEYLQSNGYKLSTSEKGRLTKQTQLNELKFYDITNVYELFKQTKKG